MSIEIKGFDALRRRLKGIERRARSLDGSHSVPLKELFSLSFMRQHTRFSSFDDMLEASPWAVKTSEDFLAIPDAQWDKFVRENTPFRTWRDMQRAAGQEWVAGKLGL